MPIVNKQVSLKYDIFKCVIFTTIMLFLPVAYLYSLISSMIELKYQIWKEDIFEKWNQTWNQVRWYRKYNGAFEKSKPAVF